MQFKLSRVRDYINSWKEKGYPQDIPDEVPGCLARLNLAPSYKAIAIALLTQDHSFTSLGYSSKKSPYYSILKKIKLTEKDKI